MTAPSNAIVTVDLKDLQRTLGPFADQVAFAASLALNRTAEEVQTRLRQELYLKFSIHNSRFMEGLVKIKREDRATKHNLVARVRIEGPRGAEERASVLIRHIKGGVSYQPNTVFDSFFVRGDGIRAMGKVARSMYPKNLRLMDRRAVDGTLHAKSHRTKTGKLQVKGKRRTFVLTEKGTGRPYGVYQREGKQDIQLIWLYTPKVRTRATYDFYGIANRVFMEKWKANMEGMLAYAISTRRRV